MRRSVPFLILFFSLCFLFSPFTVVSKAEGTKISVEMIMDNGFNAEWKSNAKKIVSILDTNGTAGLIMQSQKVMDSINNSKPASKATTQIPSRLIFLCIAAEALKVNAEMICNGEDVPAGLAELMCDTFTHDYEISEQLERYCISHISNAGLQRKKLFKKARDFFILEYSSIQRPRGN